MDLAMMSPAGEGSEMLPERRLALIHRVIVPDKDYPKEYAILVTDRRSIFIRQKKTRRSFVLRYEMRIGTALVTDVILKTLEDYEQTSLESLTADDANLTVPHEAVISLAMRAEEHEHRKRDFFLWLTMRRQEENIPGIQLRDEIQARSGPGRHDQILHGASRRVFQASETDPEQGNGTPRIRSRYA